MNYQPNIYQQNNIKFMLYYVPQFYILVIWK